MANTYGALKRVRQTERRTEFNRFAKTRLRHQIRAMRHTLAAKAPAAADVKSRHGRDILAGRQSRAQRLYQAGYGGALQEPSAQPREGRSRRKVKK